MQWASIGIVINQTQKNIEKRIALSYMKGERSYDAVRKTDNEE